uniref:NADH-ubiquinone oxidoreductase chain 1 n=1 Tax=Macrogyropus costalimai TaxID=1941320 RepID=A0A7S5WS44_9NEOP|nr:NADH dehydrogenase subunit 1 [Macrogyropus costalimai]
MYQLKKFMNLMTMNFYILLACFIQFFMFILFIALSLAFFTLMERKILGIIHFRLGPNKLILKGLLQPMADAMKLITKSDKNISWSNKFFFIFSPVFMIAISFILWFIFPHYWVLFDNSYSILVLLIFFGFEIFSLIFSSWSSNSKYAMIGMVRAISQSISQEMVLSLVFIYFMWSMKSYRLESFLNISLWFLVINLPIFLVCLISFLAMVSRTPFDLTEGESELVSGYSVEYGGIMYTLIFLSETSQLIFSSSLYKSMYFLHMVYSPHNMSLHQM